MRRDYLINRIIGFAFGLLLFVTLGYIALVVFGMLINWRPGVKTPTLPPSATNTAAPTTRPNTSTVTAEQPTRPPDKPFTPTFTATFTATNTPGSTKIADTPTPTKTPRPTLDYERGCRTPYVFNGGPNGKVVRGCP